MLELGLFTRASTFVQSVEDSGLTEGTDISIPIHEITIADLLAIADEMGSSL